MIEKVALLLIGFALGWAACRVWWDSTIEAADR